MAWSNLDWAWRQSAKLRQSILILSISLWFLSNCSLADEPLLNPFGFPASIDQRVNPYSDEPAFLVAARLGARRAAAYSEPQPSLAPPCDCQLRAQDQFWVIRTGHLPCLGCEVVDEPRLAVSQYHCVSGWNDRDFAELRQSDENTITIFYVPGNRVANDEAVRRGWLIYDWLQSAANDQTLRLIVWSWPSDKVPGQLRDFRTKAARTSTESVYLGWTLRQLDPRSRVSLLGYSYGARVSAGALHVTAGGSLEGASIAQEDVGQLSARAVFLASASHNYWLLPGEFHGHAITQVEQMLVLYNTCDPALKHYRLVEKCDRADALGFTGLITTAGSFDLASRVRQRDVAGAIGKTHDEMSYLLSPNVMSDAQRYLLWNEIGN